VKRVIYIAFFAGLALFTTLIAYQGATQVFATLAVAGWGLLAVILFYLIPMTADTCGWYVLLDREHRPRFRTFFWVRWIGVSVDTLLPVAQVGGELAKAHLLAQQQVPGAKAGASVIVNLTLTVFSQIIFTLLGLALLMHFLEGGEIIQGVLIGTVVSALSIFCFYWLQQRGLFGRLARWLEKSPIGGGWLQLVGGADALDASLLQLYSQRQRLLSSVLWTLLGWFLGSGEVWLALYFLGHPVGWLEAILIESLTQALKGAAFLIPGAIGVLEGGHIVLGSLLGLPPTVGLTLALTRRVRELCLGVPALLAWQFTEGKRLLWQRAKSSPESLSADTPLSN
jgi:putative membrane protein